MDITPATKLLVDRVQPLKLKYTDAASQAFVDFYCQCHQGLDYLLPTGVKETVRLVDILQWFCQCVDQGGPSTIVQLMWHDVVGPSLAEYTADEAIEAQLTRAFMQGDLRSSLTCWDLTRRADGGVDLPLRSLLADLHHIEQSLAQER